MKAGKALTKFWPLLYRDWPSVPVSLAINQLEEKQVGAADIAQGDKVILAEGSTRDVYGPTVALDPVKKVQAVLVPSSCAVLRKPNPPSGTVHKATAKRLKPVTREAVRRGDHYSLACR